MSFTLHTSLTSMGLRAVPGLTRWGIFYGGFEDASGEHLAYMDLHIAGRQFSIIRYYYLRLCLHLTNHDLQHTEQLQTSKVPQVRLPDRWPVNVPGH